MVIDIELTLNRLGFGRIAKNKFQLFFLRFSKWDIPDKHSVSFEITGGLSRKINMSLESLSVTARINVKALELLEQNPEGLRWVDLNKKIIESDKTLHPKTVNGSVWKLVEKFPDLVYKPSKGVFRLLKYKFTEVNTVEEYIANVPAIARATFDQLRALVKKQLPLATEVFSYGIIGYKIDDKRARVFISGWKDHVAMYPIPKNESLRSKLKPYIKGKGTLWFSLDQPLPRQIIQEAVQDLVARA